MLLDEAAAKQLWLSRTVPQKHAPLRTVNPPCPPAKAANLNPGLVHRLV